MTVRKKKVQKRKKRTLAQLRKEQAHKRRLKKLAKSAERYKEKVKKRPKLKPKPIPKPKVKARVKTPKVKRKPKGWKKIEPSKGVESMLERARMEITREYGIDGDIRRSVNADFSIDWELRFALSKRTDLNALRIDLANLLRPVPNTWLAFGWRFRRDERMSDEVADKYDRYAGGLKQVHAHYQRFTDKHIFRVSEGLDMIRRRLKERKRLKPEQLFVRVHWNLRGEKPE